MFCLARIKAVDFATLKISIRLFDRIILVGEAIQIGLRLLGSHSQLTENNKIYISEVYKVHLFTFLMLFFANDKPKHKSS